MNKITITTRNKVVHQFGEKNLLKMEDMIKQGLTTLMGSLQKQLAKEIQITNVLLDCVDSQLVSTSEFYPTVVVKGLKQSRVQWMIAGKQQLLRGMIDSIMKIPLSSNLMFDEFDKSIAEELMNTVNHDVTAHLSTLLGQSVKKTETLLEFVNQENSNLISLVWSNVNLLEVRFDILVDGLNRIPVGFYIEEAKLTDFFSTVAEESANVVTSARPYFTRPIIQNNIDLVRNIPLTISVEFGSTKRKIKDILEFQPGTVIELDKQNGMPVDVIINGAVFGHGEIVVIEENFGVRLTQLSKDGLKIE